MIQRRAVRRFGDAALIAPTPSISEAHALAASVSAAGWDGVQDVVVGDASLTVLVDAWDSDLDLLADLFAEIAPLAQPGRELITVEIPVV
ncbi:MAG: hypothetical protein ACRDV4_09815, partial [Acidimicrobiales bacterium]